MRYPSAVIVQIEFPWYSSCLLFAFLHLGHGSRFPLFFPVLLLLPLAAQHSMNFTLNLCFCTRGLAVAVVPHDPPCSVPLLVFIHLSVVPRDRDTRRSRPSEFRSYVVNYSGSFSGISLWSGCFFLLFIKDQSVKENTEHICFGGSNRRKKNVSSVYVVITTTFSSSSVACATQCH